MCVTERESHGRLPRHTFAQVVLGLSSVATTARAAVQRRKKNPQRVGEADGARLLTADLRPEREERIIAADEKRLALKRVLLQDESPRGRRFRFFRVTLEN